jgi:hypothetical protein
MPLPEFIHGAAVTQVAAGAAKQTSCGHLRPNPINPPHASA